MRERIALFICRYIRGHDLVPFYGQFSWPTFWRCRRCWKQWPTNLMASARTATTYPAPTYRVRH